MRETKKSAAPFTPELLDRILAKMKEADDQPKEIPPLAIWHRDYKTYLRMKEKPSVSSSNY